MRLALVIRKLNCEAYAVVFLRNENDSVVKL